MQPRTAPMPAATRTIAVAAVAIAALLFSFTPLASFVDAKLLDVQWHLRQRTVSMPPPEDIVIVGIDEETLRRVPQPAGLWHEPLGLALARIAAARPRAIGPDFRLPDKSFDQAHPGLDRALGLGIAAARANGPFVVTVAIDPATREARPIHAPFLTLLHAERLGVGLLARDVDGVTRRFSLAIPTQQGSFPTFAGRLCTALQRGCRDGFLDFAAGAPFRSVPLHAVLEAADLAQLEALFRGRVVLIGETLRLANRVRVPIGYADWEARDTGDTPQIVVQALALRTALDGSAPQAASLPWTFVLAVLGALVAMLRFPWSIAGGIAAGTALVLAGFMALRSGVVLSLGTPLVAVLLAMAVSAAGAVTQRYEVRRRT